MVTFLIEQGANLNFDDVMSGLQFDTLKIMVQHGADLKKKNSQGRTILYETIYRNNVNMVEYLLE